MKKRTTTYLMVIAIMCSLIPLAGTVRAADPAAPSFQIISNVQQVNVGQQVQFDIVGRNLADVHAFEVKLEFDSNRLAFTGAESALEGMELEQIGSGSFLYAYVAKESVEGNQVLLTVTFEGRTAGSAAVSLISVKTMDNILKESHYSKVQTVQVPVHHSPSVLTPPSQPSAEEEWLEDLKAVIESNKTDYEIQLEISQWLETIGQLQPESMQTAVSEDRIIVEVSKETMEQQLNSLTDAWDKIHAILQTANKQGIAQSLKKEIKLVLTDSRKQSLFTLPAESVKQLDENGVGIAVVLDDAVLRFPPLSMEVDEDSRNNGATLQLGLRRLTADELQQAGAAARTGMTPVSNCYDLTLQIVQGNVTREIEQFRTKVTLELSYAGSAADEDKLGIYRFNPQEPGWEYAGGSTNKENKTVTILTGHFSVYAVMEYHKTFADIEQHWAQRDIEVMAAKHVVNGMDDGTFQPDQAVTRAQFASLLVRAMGWDSTPYSGKFADITGGEWYADLVETAVAHHIIEGDGVSFRPEDQITREEMAVIMMRAYGELPESERQEDAAPPFADAHIISPWALEAVHQAQALGIIAGITETTFAPQETASRAQAATIIRRMLDKL